MDWLHTFLRRYSNVGCDHNRSLHTFLGRYSNVRCDDNRSLEAGPFRSPAPPQRALPRGPQRCACSTSAHHTLNQNGKLLARSIRLTSILWKKRTEFENGIVNMYTVTYYREIRQKSEVDNHRGRRQQRSWRRCTKRGNEDPKNEKETKS